jgi:hypothetical protein
LATLLSKNEDQLNFVWLASYTVVSCRTYLLALKKQSSWSGDVFNEDLADLFAQAGVDMQDVGLIHQWSNSGNRWLPFPHQPKRLLGYTAGKDTEAEELPKIEMLGAFSRKEGFLNTILRMASFSDKCTVMEDLIHRGARIEAQDSLKRRPLHYAAANCSFGAVEFLLSSGASRSAADWYRHTPGFYARLQQVPQFIISLLDTEILSLEEIPQSGTDQRCKTNTPKNV